MKYWSLFLSSLLFTLTVQAQEVVSLYGGEIPLSKPAPNREESYWGSDGKERIRKVSQPSLTVFLPSDTKRQHTAVIICPGGGYEHLSIVGEGYEVAKLLNEWGIAAFVLKYRMPNDSTMQQKELGPLQDAQRALELVRTKSKEWNINPRKVGVMGFSAGGHLAATLGTHFKQPVTTKPAKLDLRPNFMILVYAGISVPDSISSMDNRLLGKNTPQERIDRYLKGFTLSPKTPPAFLVHAKDDRTVNVKNSTSFYEKLQENKVPAEIHLYEKGGHGFGLNNKMSKERWTDWLKTWLSKMHF
ncbi:MAG: alpha/beta hydrolase [Sphingobacteriaceae bacterium]